MKQCDMSFSSVITNMLDDLDKLPEPTAFGDSRIPSCNASSRMLSVQVMRR